MVTKVVNKVVCAYATAIAMLEKATGGYVVNLAMLETALCVHSVLGKDARQTPHCAHRHLLHQNPTVARSTKVEHNF